MPSPFDIAAMAEKTLARTGQQVAGVMQLIQSRKEKKQANKLEKNLAPVTYNIQKPILDNQALAESLGSQGLSDQALEVYRASSDRKLGNSVNAILMGGGSVNNIADLYDTAQQGDQHIALLEEEVRQKNLQTLMRQNEVLAGEQEKAWMINEYAPYQDTKQLISQLRNQANQNKWNGINSIIGGANNAATGNLMGSSGAPDISSFVRPQVTSVINPNQQSIGVSNTDRFTTAPDYTSVQTNYYLDMLKKRSFAQ